MVKLLPKLRWKSSSPSTSQNRPETPSGHKEPNTVLNAFKFALDIMESAGGLVPGLPPAAKGISMVIDAIEVRSVML
jgi:hypothetical protein